MDCCRRHTDRSSADGVHHHRQHRRSPMAALDHPSVRREYDDDDGGDGAWLTSTWTTWTTRIRPPFAGEAVTIGPNAVACPAKRRKTAELGCQHSHCHCLEVPMHSVWTYSTVDDHHHLPFRCCFPPPSEWSTQIHHPHHHRRPVTFAADCAVSPRAATWPVDSRTTPESVLPAAQSCPPAVPWQTRPDSAFAQTPAPDCRSVRW